MTYCFRNISRCGSTNVSYWNGTFGWTDFLRMKHDQYGIEKKYFPVDPGLNVQLTNTTDFQSMTYSITSELHILFEEDH